MDFVKGTRTSVALAIALVLISLASLAVQQLNFSIDFTGGTSFDLVMANPVTSGAVRNALGDLGADSTIKLAGAGSEVIVTTPPLDETGEQDVLQRLRTAFPGVTVLSVEQVSGSISGEMTRKALLALALASLLQIAYLTWRFELRFAVIGVGTILLDALVVIGVFSLLQWEVNASFVAAILTIIGYSINDKVIVFDRIRENLRQRGRDETLSELVNRSIGETLRRSIYTGLTTIAAIAAVAIFGGVTTRTFALGMMIGITFGTLTSIFIAGPVWRLWEQAARGHASARPV